MHLPAAALVLLCIAAHAVDAPTPQLLAPGVLSTGDDEWGFTMNPHGDALLFNNA